MRHTFQDLSLQPLSDEYSRKSGGLKMRPFLVTALTVLALVVNGVVGQCSTFQTQVNVSMCNWQGLRGTHSFVFLAEMRKCLALLTGPFVLIFIHSHCLARYVIFRWRENLVPTV